MSTFKLNSERASVTATQDNFNSQSLGQATDLKVSDANSLTQHAPILLLDDEPQITHLYEVLMARVGLRTVAFSNMQAALDYIAHKPVSLVISELLRPYINGLDVLEILRRDPVTTHIPFIMITATPEYDSRRLFNTLGGNVFLTKPINTRQLTQLVNQLLTDQLVKEPFH